MDHHLCKTIVLAGNLLIIILILVCLSCYTLRYFWRRQWTTTKSLFPTSENNVTQKHICRSRRSYIDLPREITFNILILLPAEILHKVARKVCKQWDDIVNNPFFIRAHCQMSTTRARFLVQACNKLHKAYYVEAEDTKSPRVTEFEFPSPVIISSSSNGLVLLSDRKDEGLLHLMNLVTEVIITLPRLMALNSWYYYARDNLAVNSSGRYKAVRVYSDKDHKKVEINTFTIGIDKAWRRLEIRGISMNPEAKSAMLESAIFVPGFMYWCTDYCLVCFAMDVDTETIYQFHGPEDFDIYTSPIHYISLGTGLGVIMADVNEHERSIWRLWKLTDVKSSKWTEIATINIGAIVGKVDKTAYDSLTVFPISLIDGELCFKYRVVKQEFFRVVRYNLANENFVSFRIRTVPFNAYIYPHVPTLVSPKNR